jgi:hypothetical protein
MLLPHRCTCFVVHRTVQSADHQSASALFENLIRIPVKSRYMHSTTSSRSARPYISTHQPSHSSTSPSLPFYNHSANNYHVPSCHRHRSRSFQSPSLPPFLPAYSPSLSDRLCSRQRLIIISPCSNSRFGSQDHLRMSICPGETDSCILT